MHKNSSYKQATRLTIGVIKTKKLQFYHTKH